MRLASPPATVRFAPNFATTMNVINVLKDTSFLAILALGFTLALIVSELDLSIAEVASLSAVVTGMRPGGKRRALLPPSAAYGALPAGLPQPPTFAARRQVVNHAREPLVFEVVAVRVNGKGAPAR